MGAAEPPTIEAPGVAMPPASTRTSSPGPDAPPPPRAASGAAEQQRADAAGAAAASADDDKVGRSPRGCLPPPLPDPLPFPPLHCRRKARCPSNPSLPQQPVLPLHRLPLHLPLAPSLMHRNLLLPLRTTTPSLAKCLPLKQCSMLRRPHRAPRGPLQAAQRHLSLWGARSGGAS